MTPDDQGGGSAGLTHLNAAGEARMVDVSDKPVTVREATAAGRVRLSAECVAALRDGRDSRLAFS